MTRPTHRIVAAIFAAAALLIASGCAGNTANIAGVGEHADPEVLRYAVLPADRPAVVQQAHQPILEMLKKETGKEIHFQTGNDYAAIIQGLVAGKFDIAALGALSYVQAKQQGAQITVVAVRVDEKGEEPGYQSYGITRVGSPIKALADFRGKKICFVDRSSTSGYLYPSAALLDIGIDPEKDTVPSFKGHHDAVVLAVANQQCDAGFAIDRLIDHPLTEDRRLQADQITTVWKSETVLGPSLVIANHLAPELRQRLTTALQHNANAEYLRANGFCQGECAIADGVAYGYQQIDDAYYNGIREICRRIQNESCTGG